jgi:hypothetical protein
MTIRISLGLFYESRLGDRLELAMQGYYHMPTKLPTMSFSLLRETEACKEQLSELLIQY